LPSQASAPFAASTSPPSRPTLEAPLVLVVDDDEDTRFLYTLALADMGYRTAGESDGARGAEAAARLVPHAILMDVSMPIMNGIDATHRIKGDPRSRGCLVVLMTGHGMTKFDEARAAGCDAFLAKPFSPLALAELLRTLATSVDDSKLEVRPERVKECSCGRQYSLTQWLALPTCGRMRIPRRGVAVELRTCVCGSSLSVELDDLGAAVVQPVRAAVPRDGASLAARGTILVVDRDAHVRRLLQRFLGEAYAVEFSEDGYSALDRVRASPPAAVVTEILIPRLDGLALCRSLKGDPSTRLVPVLVTSVLMASERARQSGADDFLEKPLEKVSVLAAVRALTERATETRTT
jgi:two-component system response regulator MprA